MKIGKGNSINRFPPRFDRIMKIGKGSGKGGEHSVNAAQLEWMGNRVELLDSMMGKGQGFDALDKAAGEEEEEQSEEQEL